MAFTESDLTALEAAIKSGTLKVKYGDKEVTYHSMSDLFAARNLIRGELNAASGNSARRTAASFDPD